MSAITTLSRCPACGTPSRPPPAGLVLDGNKLRIPGQPAVHLTTQEAKIVALLAAAHGPISRDRLYTILYRGCTPGTENTLSVVLSKIRHKLRGLGVTVSSGHRFGYVMEIEAP